MAFISFENIAGDGKLKKVPDGYSDLDWNNFFAIDDDYYLGTNFEKAIRTGEAAAFNGLEDPAGFKSADRFNDFDLNSGHFAAFNADDLRVKVVAYDDGEKVATKFLVLDPSREFVRFGPLFDSIDEVRFTPRGGTDADPDDGIPVFHTFGVDDLFII